MNKVVFTGGPCSGKTTVLNNVKEKLQKTIFVKEVATRVIKKNGIPKTYDHLLRNQKEIFTIQQKIEYNINKKFPDHLRVFDRGVLDGVPYFKGGAIEFQDFLKCRIQNLYKNYDFLIFFDSLAFFNPQLFLEKKGSNPARFENLSQAVKTNKATYNIMKKHPGFIYLPPCLTLKDKIKTSIEILKILKKEKPKQIKGLQHVKYYSH